MLRVFLAFLLLSLSLSVPVLAQEGGQKTMLRLYADKTAAVAGEPLRLAIEQVITEGWHTYWVNPGDSGEPMKIKWDMPRGIKMGELMWPAPSRIPYGPLMNFGYHDSAVILTDVTVPSSLKAGDTFGIKGRATILVCDEICIPESHDISFDIPVAATSAPANEDLFKVAAGAIPNPLTGPSPRKSMQTRRVSASLFRLMKKILTTMSLTSSGSLTSGGTFSTRPIKAQPSRPAQTR